MKDTITVEAVGEHLLNLEKEIAHLTKVTQMHRRIIDMLVKDMVMLKPKRMVCDNSQALGDHPKYRKGHADGVQEVIDHTNKFGE